MTPETYMIIYTIKNLMNRWEEMKKILKIIEKEFYWWNFCEGNVYDRNIKINHNTEIILKTQQKWKHALKNFQII